MKPVELHVYDFDGALYDSPRLRVDRPDWWYSAKSLQGWGAPGHDPKWILGTVMEARRSVRTPWVRTALLTGRPLHGEMLSTLKKMLRAAHLPFNEVQLKPLLPPTDTPAYKAIRVVDWLSEHPTIHKVVFYDDLPENLAAMGHALSYYQDVEYVPVLTPGVS